MGNMQIGLNPMVQGSSGQRHNPQVAASNPQMFQMLISLLMGGEKEEAGLEEMVKDLLGTSGQLEGEGIEENPVLEMDLLSQMQMTMVINQQVEKSAGMSPVNSQLDSKMVIKTADGNLNSTTDKQIGALDAVKKEDGFEQMAKSNQKNEAIFAKTLDIESAVANLEKPQLKEVPKQALAAQIGKVGSKTEEQLKRVDDSPQFITDVKMDSEKNQHIQKIPQIPESKVQQNVEKIEQTMIKLMETVKEGDTSRMSVKLEPEALGKVDLDLRMENGRLTARIFVENQQVRELFEGKIVELTTSLQRNNIQVEKIHLQVSSGSENQQLDMGQQGSFQRGQDRGTWQQTNHLFKRLEGIKAVSQGTKPQEGLSILA